MIKNKVRLFFLPFDFVILGYTPNLLNFLRKLTLYILLYLYQ